jgi:membrane protein required for colicin V production
MTIFEIAVLLVILLSALAGFATGLIRSVFSLAGLILGIAIASARYKVVAHRLGGLIDSPAFAQLVAFCIVAILVMVLAGLAGWFLRKLVHGVGLGWLDRSLGLLFGILRGALLVTLLVMALAAFFPTTAWMQDTWLEQRFLGAAQAATHLTTPEMKARVLDGIAHLRKHLPAMPSL